MAKILSGKEVAGRIQEDLIRRVEVLKTHGALPCLCIIRIGEKSADISYERGASARCEKAGILCRKVTLSADILQEEVLRVIDALNEDRSVHGILLLRPLPRHLDEKAIVNRVSPGKDVDGMTDLSMSRLLGGRQNGFFPCTAEAAMEFLDYYGIDAAGRSAVVIGRSTVFGKPAALMLLSRDATVTICHTKTKDLPAVARQANILLCAAGCAGVVGPECVREGQIVIDVGINLGDDGKLCGDVSFDEVKETVGAITPVPGGVGAVTTAVLLRHVVESCERKMKNVL